MVGLVYDVSRWGRFQDADESAYYEYICKRAGISVHYCAEQFENDGSPVSTIVKGVKPKAIKGLTDEQISLMERESGNLEREFKMAEQSYGTDHLDLVLAKGYLGNLLGNPRVVRYLVQNHREILVEFQKIAELETAAA